MIGLYLVGKFVLKKFFRISNFRQIYSKYPCYPKKNEFIFIKFLSLNFIMFCNV